jgi:prolyl oligopeptidase
MKNQHGYWTVDDQNFYLQTDRKCTNRETGYHAHRQSPEASWKTLVETKPEVLNASTAGGTIFCSYLKDAVTKVVQNDKSGKQLREIELPGLGTADGFYAKEKDKALYYSFTGYTTPGTIYKLDIESGKSELYKKPTVQFKPEEFESKQVFYTSKDGTKIPMIITHKKGIELNGRTPVCYMVMVVLV